QRGVIAWVSQVLAILARRWKWTRPMLRAAVAVEADIVRHAGVSLSQRIGMGERACPGPVLGRRLRMHAQRSRLAGGRPTEDAIGGAGVGIGLRLVGEGEAVGREVAQFVLGDKRRRLGEAMI